MNYKDLDEIKYEPKIEDSKLKLELSLMLNAIYSHIDMKLSKLAESIKDSTNIEGIESQLNQFRTFLEPLISGNELATIATSGETVDASQLTGTINVARLPNNISLAKLDSKIIKTDDNLTITAGVFAVGGKIILKDNNGHNVEVLTP